MCILKHEGCRDCVLTLEKAHFDTLKPVKPTLLLEQYIFFSESSTQRIKTTKVFFSMIKIAGAIFCQKRLNLAYW